MGKKNNKVNEDELTGLIRSIHAKYPPSGERNIVEAFKDLVSGNPEIIKYTQWLKIYREGKTPETIAKEILHAPKIRVYNEYGGRGGQRGISKKWELYKKAEEILFDTKGVLGKFKTAYDPLRFLLLLRNLFPYYRKRYNQFEPEDTDLADCLGLVEHKKIPPVAIM